MKYLLAYDGSANSKQALDFTIKLMKPADDQLVVLTVTERIPQADWPFFGDGALHSSLTNHHCWSALHAL